MSTLLTVILSSVIGAVPADNDIVQGTVTTPSGTPVAGAEVFVVLSAMGDDLAHTTTKEDGSFALTLPQKDIAERMSFLPHISVTAVKNGWGVAGTSQSVATAVRRPIDIRLSRAKTVSLELRDPQGKPLPAADVTIKWLPGGSFSLPGGAVARGSPRS